MDLGAEKFIGAEKGDKKIAVEVKSFLGPSSMRNLENSLGQYVLYYEIMQEVEPIREIYLAVHQEIWEEVFDEPVGTLLIAKRKLQLIVFDEEQEVITKWLP